MSARLALRINGVLALLWGIGFIFGQKAICEMYLKDSSSINEYVFWIMKYCGLTNISLGLLYWVIANEAKISIQRRVLTIIGVITCFSTYVAFENRHLNKDGAFIQVFIQNAILALINLFIGTGIKEKFM